MRVLSDGFWCVITDNIEMMSSWVSSTMSITGILLPVAREYREPWRAPQVSERMLTREASMIREGGVARAASPPISRTSPGRGPLLPCGYQSPRRSHAIPEERDDRGRAAGVDRSRRRDPEGRRQCRRRRHRLRPRAGRGRPPDVRYRGLRKLRHRDAGEGIPRLHRLSRARAARRPPRHVGRPHRVGGAPSGWRSRRPAGRSTAVPTARPSAWAIAW
jgi:hypothetical protein